MTEEHVPAQAAPVQEYSAPSPAPAYESPEHSTASPSAPFGDLIVQAKLAVGPASDPYEDEADAVAHQVVKSLRVQRKTDGASVAGAQAAPAERIARRHMIGGVATPPPAIDVQRIMRASTNQSLPAAIARPVPTSRIQRAATIGAEGGDVDTDTEQAIRRSSGRVMPAPARTAMEGAFGADFSGVRVHTGPAASELSTRIQAKAFTTGNDIFFRDGMPDTSTASGQNLLAHELTHTIQQTGQTQRSAAVMRKWWGLGKKKQSDPPVVTPPLAAGPESPDTQALLAKMGYSTVVAAGAGAKDPNAEPAAAPEPAAAAQPADDRPEGQAYSGKAAKTADARIEAAKPAAAVTVAGTAGASAAGAVGNVNLAGGVGGGVLGLAAAGDAAMGLASAKAMSDEAELHGDAAMGKQAGLKAKDQGAALGMGLANTGRGVAATVDVAQGSAAAVAEGAAPAAAGVAAGALGVIAGSAMVIQGTWRGGKAAVKLFKLTHGSGQQMLSADGERWKKVIVAAEKFKVAINGLKVAAGALGVAAGALMIVGSPIGWAVGLAAAIVGGAYAASKLIGKIRNARDKMNAHATAAGLPLIGEPTDVTRHTGGGEQEPVSLQDMGYDMSKVIQAGPQNAQDTGSGFEDDAAADGGERDDSAARVAAIEEADRIATAASKNAKTAAELRAALADGDKEYVMAMVEAVLGNPDDDLAGIITAPADQRLHDSFSLLSAINIDPDLALADSGQALIEQKLSKAEAM